uniref:Astacin domain-containing protein n=1 Tax=Strongyloides papillosus TaxID=174720 RepID=A0A0N5BDB7_STREA
MKIFFTKEFILLAIVTFFIKGRRRFEIRDETRKSLSDIKKNFEDTVVGLKGLNKLQRRLIGLQDRNETKDEDTKVVDESSKVNPDLCECDIILTENQINKLVNDVVQQVERKNIDVGDIESRARKSKIVKLSIMKDINKMWTSPIPYYVDTGVNATLVTAALKGIESETCIRFTKSTTPITGVYHEQSRPDRPACVTVLTGSIISEKEFNFVLNVKSFIKEYGIPYDFGSVMHCKRYDFLSNGNQTIVAIDQKYDKSMEQKNRLSFND